MNVFYRVIAFLLVLIISLGFIVPACFSSNQWEIFWIGPIWLFIVFPWLAWVTGKSAFKAVKGAIEDEGTTG